MEPCCLLIVDDDGDVADAIEIVLVPFFDCRVLRAASAREALAALATLERVPRPCVVVSDVHMPPGMDGCALAAAIRAEPRYRPVRVLLVSSVDIAAASHVADGFLRKPFEVAELRAEVERLLCQSKAST